MFKFMKKSLTLGLVFTLFASSGAYAVNTDGSAFEDAFLRNGEKYTAMTYTNSQTSALTVENGVTSVSCTPKYQNTRVLEQFRWNTTNSSGRSVRTPFVFTGEFNFESIEKAGKVRLALEKFKGTNAESIPFWVQFFSDGKMIAGPSSDAKVKFDGWLNADEYAVTLSDGTNGLVVYDGDVSGEWIRVKVFLDPYTGGGVFSAGRVDDDGNFVSSVCDFGFKIDSRALLTKTTASDQSSAMWYNIGVQCPSGKTEFKMRNLSLTCEDVWADGDTVINIDKNTVSASQTWLGYGFKWEKYTVPETVVSLYDENENLVAYSVKKDVSIAGRGTGLYGYTSAEAKTDVTDLSNLPDGKYTVRAFSWSGINSAKPYFNTAAEKEINIANGSVTE